jgi:hypothetical protein
MTSAELLSVLRDLERSAAPALIRFRDGDAYVVRVISTMHAEAGDNIVAEVLRPVSAAAGVPVPARAFMDFLLGDVAEVLQDVAHVSDFAPDAEQGAAPDRPRD